MDDRSRPSDAPVTFTEWQSPIGPLHIAEREGAIIRLALPGHGRGDFATRLEHDSGGEVVRFAAPSDSTPSHTPDRLPGTAGGQSALTTAIDELSRYFAGALTEFSVPVDLGLSAGFGRSVLEATSLIPHGATRSYGEIAEAAGSPRAVRAAGCALGSNPVPLIVPCHRVIRSDGSTGKYGGGSELKRWLLALESGLAS